MTFLLACLLFMLLMVIAAGLLEAWARYRGWRGFE